MQTNKFQYSLIFILLGIFSCMPTTNDTELETPNSKQNKMMDSKPVVQAQMMIRKPVSDVYNAFVDPTITKHFWFTKSSGPLEQGKTVKWEWEMYGVSTEVQVSQLIPQKMIVYTWGPPYATVEIEFLAVSEESTYVSIKNFGFEQTGDELISVLQDGTGGFTIVLAGLKAYLEHGIDLNLIGDKFPKEVADLNK